jgi:ferredoxin
MPTRVRVAGTDRVFRISPGEDLLEVLQSNEEPITTACGGVAFCGTCWVTVVSGEESLVPIKVQEIVHLGSGASHAGLRLACQAQLRRDVDPDDEDELVVCIPPPDAPLPSPP